jgi:hypothetical protein
MTMKLKDRVTLAGRNMLGLLDADNDFMPTGGYEVAHDLGRFWDAILRVEESVGFTIPADLKAASLANLRRLTDNPDRLLHNRPEVSYMAPKAKLNTHNFRETLLAMGGLIRRRRSHWAAESAAHLVEVIDRVVLPDGRLDLSQMGTWGQLPGPDTPIVGKAGEWFDTTTTSGRCLEALVWLYEETGDDRVLDLSRRIATHHLEYTTTDDGSVQPGFIDPKNGGHNHSYHGTLRGLLLYGLLTGQKEYVDRVEATYRRGVRLQIVKESGWTPHDLGKTRFPNDFGDPVSDPASTGDSAQIALWLALDAGCGDLLDDVERYVRSRLAPSQLTQVDADAHPDIEVTERDIGTWGIHLPTHGGKKCTPDVAAAVTHTMCDIYNNICTQSATGRQVNLHFDYEDADITVTSTRTARGQVAIRLAQPESVMVRIPGWAPESSLELTVDGKATPIKHLGQYAWVPGGALRTGSEMVLTYDLPERVTKEEMPSGRVYTIAWRGDEIVGIDPQDGPMPFFPALGGDAA